MGGTCSGAKSSQAITPKSVTELNSVAHSSLRKMKAGYSGTPSKDKLDDTLGRGTPRGGEDSNVRDLASDCPIGVSRKHEPLWLAIEGNEPEKAKKYLDKLIDKGDSIEEADLMDSNGQSMLHRAGQLGHAEILMLMLERSGAKPDLPNGQLATPLHLASRHDREGVVRFLIGCGVDVNCQDEHGQTPILVCCIHGHKDLASFLIESSIAGHLPEQLDIDVKDHRGLTPLNCAAIKGDLELTKILVGRGGANVNQTSPKGCTPLIYAGRGGYGKVVQYLLEKKASPLKQDNAGGTVLHHAIEKGHMEVLETMLQHGVDVYSAIEIADNAGRTALFEAVENAEETVGIKLTQEGEPEDPSRIIKMLITKRANGGFGAKANVVNFNGQTPMFSAVREGNFEAVRCLVELGDAKPDLNGGELVKIEEQEQEDDDEEYESQEEKYFMMAFKNCMTPIHVATVLGYDEIALYLIERGGADVDYATGKRKFTPLHLAVLANKPEMIIELLTKTNADPMVEDWEGQSLLDMVYKYIPTYVESFQALLENLQVHRLKSRGEAANTNVARHYVHPDDDRKIQGVQDDKAIKQMYEHQVADVDTLGLEGNDPNKEEVKSKQLGDVEEEDIEIPEDMELDARIESVFGRKIAIALISLNWKYKEMAIKVVSKQTEKSLNKPDNTNIDLIELIEAATAAVGITCQEKVIKVFNVALALFNSMVSSSKIDQDTTAMRRFFAAIEKEEIVPKLLTKSEESNTRITNKIHEALLDLSYHPKIGEDFVAASLLTQIKQHYEQKSQNYKGLLAQLALLFKMINSFGLAFSDQGNTGSAMTLEVVIAVAIPAIAHPNKDVKNAAIKILLDVQRMSGQVTEVHLESLPEKTKEMVWDKVCETEVEKKDELLGRTIKPGQVSVNVVNIGLMPNSDEGADEELKVNTQMIMKEQTVTNKENFQRLKKIILEKGIHKDWTQREIALTSLQECFEVVHQRELIEEQEFLTNCTVLLKSSLEENNIQIYLLAVTAAAIFFSKSLWYDTVLDALQSLLKAIILRTADTNTRVRKKSVDIINQVWEANPPMAVTNISGKKQGSSATKDMISSQIAEIICDSQLQEKSIIGRLGLLIKRSMIIESPEDLSKRSHQVIFGKDYEQITEFACHWCSHKSTKVRQSALKLIVEMCRVNFIDPRGAPFKQRIINFILGLRPSLRDPLVTKINEVCLQQSQENSGDSPVKLFATKNQPYINTSELELSVATNHRSASMGMRASGPRAQALRQSQNKENQGGLPQIGGLPNVQPALQAVSGPSQQPTIVLPHSEPLTEQQIEEADSAIQLFGKEIMTCTFSQTWSTRQAAIQKIQEQLHNLDPQRRDAMFGEINRQNLPVELTFKTFLEYCQNGLNDPVLKNYILILELIQQALPVFFRNVPPEQLKSALLPLVSCILKKTSNLQQKVREASINFCLYLAHQSPIGPKIMVEQVIIELNTVQTEAGKGAKLSGASKNAAASYGNSHMIASCLKLLQAYQSQTKIVNKENAGDMLYADFMMNINLALKHQNPQVRKEAEALFKVLYKEFGETLNRELVDQKAQVVQKLLSECKAEILASSTTTSQAIPKPGNAADMDQARKTAEAFGIAKAQSQITSDYLNEDAILDLLNRKKDILDQLKLPNVKKRQRAIVEIKKIIQQKISHVNSSTARDLFEPISLLMRQLLTDDAVEVYLESLNLLKYVVSALAPHLSSLDLHLMMGSFIGLIVNQTGKDNMRIRVASDKVIVFFAKHNSIGSYIVAKEVLKNIERINKYLSIAVSSAPSHPMSHTADSLGSAVAAADELTLRKDSLSRFYNILNMLLQQFSIVLCYQPDFYSKCLDLVAETMSFCQEEPILKTSCSQIIISLYQIDQKLLDSSVSKLEVAKKSHIRKVMIEFDNLTQKTKGLQQVNMTSAGSSNIIGGERMSSPNQSFRDTQQSFASITTKQSGNDGFGPGQHAMLSPFDRRTQQSREFGSRPAVDMKADTSLKWNSSSTGTGHRQRERNSEVRQSNGDNSYKNVGYSLDHQSFDEVVSNTGGSWLQNQNRTDRRNRMNQSNPDGSALPDIDTTPGRKRSMQGGMGTGAKVAAGFNSKDVIDKTEGRRRENPATNAGFGVGIMNAGGINLGMGGSQPTANAEMSSTQFSGGYQPSVMTQAAVAKSPDKRRRSQQRMAGAMTSHYDVTQSSAAASNARAGEGPSRPPLYVNTRRGDENSVQSSITSLKMKSELSASTNGVMNGGGYQPSAIQRAQPESNILGKRSSFGEANNASNERPRFGENSREFQDSGMNQPPSGSRFQIQPMKQTAAMKPPMGQGPVGPSKMKASAPPVATFEFKTQTTTYKESDKRKSEYKPDILM